jgi:hypothetical protein
MSGGHYDYMCFKIENTYENELEDREMNELLKDFCQLLHDLEWWKSGDISERDYRIAIDTFKIKWFERRKK